MRAGNKNLTKSTQVQLVELQPLTAVSRNGNVLRACNLFERKKSSDSDLSQNDSVTSTLFPRNVLVKSNKNNFFSKDNIFQKCINQDIDQVKGLMDMHKFVTVERIINGVKRKFNIESDTVCLKNASAETLNQLRSIGDNLKMHIELVEKHPDGLKVLNELEESLSRL